MSNNTKTAKKNPSEIVWSSLSKNHVQKLPKEAQDFRTTIAPHISDFIQNINSFSNLTLPERHQPQQLKAKFDELLDKWDNRVVHEQEGDYCAVLVEEWIKYLGLRQIEKPA